MEQRVWVKFPPNGGGGDFYGGFSDVATGLWRGMFEPYAISQMVPAFQMGQNGRRRRPPNLEGLPRQWTTITLRKYML
jgi:hypothetical protein